MRASAFQVLPVPDGVTAQHNRAGREQDGRGGHRAAEGAVQRLVIGDDGEGIEHSVENDAGHQALSFVEQDDQRATDQHGKEDLAESFRQVLAVQQFFFSMALNRKRRKMSSSRKPTLSMLATKSALSAGEKRSVGLKAGLYRHTSTSGMKNQACASR